MPYSKPHWTPEETAALLSEWQKTYGPAFEPRPRFINAIQVVLPESRRRKISVKFQYEELYHQIKELPQPAPAPAAAPDEAAAAGGGKKRKPRVSWNPGEWKALASEYVALYGHAPLRVGALNVIQSVLPAARRRKVTCLTAITPHLAPLIEEIVTAPVETIREIEKPVDVDEVLRGVPLSRLIAETAARMDATLRELMAGVNGIRARLEGLTHLGGFEPLPPPRATQNGSSAPPARARVCIVGPLAVHFQHFKRRFATHPLEIIGIDKDKSPNESALPRSAAEFIIDAKFVRHSWTALITDFGKKHNMPVTTLFGQHAVVERLEEISASVSMKH